MTLALWQRSLPLSGATNVGTGVARPAKPARTPHSTLRAAGGALEVAVRAVVRVVGGQRRAQQLCLSVRIQQPSARAHRCSSG